MIQLGSIPTSKLVSQIPYWDSSSYKNLDLYFDATRNGYKNKPISGTDLSSLISSTHPQSIMMQNAAGVFVSKAANVLTQETGVGLQAIPTRQNQIPRSDLSGAVVGVVGSGGVLPAGMIWQIGGGVSISAEVQALSTDARGLPRMRLRLQGATNTTGATQFPRFRFMSDVALADATPWTGSAYYNLISSTHVVSASVEGATPFDNMGGAAAGASKNISIGESFVSCTGTKTASGGTLVRYHIGISQPAGETFDIIIEVSAPQMEQSPFSTSPILTPSNIMTRTGDLQITTGLSSLLANGFSCFVKVQHIAIEPLKFVFMISDGTSNNRIRIQSGSGTQMSGLTTANNVDTGMGITITSSIGIHTYVISAGSGFHAIREVGGTQGTNLVAAYPTGMDRIGWGGRGFAADANSYQNILKFGLKAGPQNQASFDAMYAIAQTASINSTTIL